MFNSNKPFQYNKLSVAIFMLGTGYLTSNAGPVNAANLTGYLDNYDSTLYIGLGGDNEGLNMSGGYIDSGIIQSDADSRNLFTQNYSRGTLESVTLNGSLDITGDYASATIRRGLRVNDADGFSPGTINITGSNTSLYFSENLTLDNANIQLGNTTRSLISGSASKLKLGENLNLQTNQNANLYVAELLNQGNIDVTNGTTTVFGKFLNQQGNYIGKFNNTGSIDVNNGSTFIVENEASENNGEISAENSTLNFSGTNFGEINGNDSIINLNGTNHGIITTFKGTLNLNGDWLSSDSNINTTDTNLGLGGSFNASDVNMINRSGGKITLLGSLNNVGNTLDLGKDSLFADLTLAGGTIHGGIIKSDSTPINLFKSDNSIGTLVGVQIDGTLNIKGENAKVSIQNGITVLPSNTDFPNMIRVSGNFAELSIKGTQTLDNTILKISNNSKFTQNTGVLTLGKNLTIETNNESYFTSSISGESIINKGLVTNTSGNINMTVGHFLNNGVLDIKENTSYQSNYINIENLDNKGTLNLGGFSTINSQEFSNSGKMMVYYGSIYADNITNTGDMLIRSSLSVVTDNFSNTGNIQLTSYSTGLDKRSNNGESNQLVNDGVIAGYGTVSVYHWTDTFDRINDTFVNNKTIIPYSNYSYSNMNFNSNFLQAETGLISLDLNRGSIDSTSTGFLNINGDVTFGGTLKLNNSGSLAIGDLVTLLTFSGDYLGGAFNLDSTGINNLGFDLLYNNNSVKLRVGAYTAAPVPVPSAVWFFGSALIGLLSLSRKTKKQIG